MALGAEGGGGSRRRPSLEVLRGGATSRTLAANPLDAPLAVAAAVGSGAEQCGSGVGAAAGGRSRTRSSSDLLPA